MPRRVVGERRAFRHLGNRISSVPHKRYLSHTKLSYLYTPGTEPLVFEVDGIRFGTALCIEANFPHLFEQYEQMDVDCLLISVMVDDAARAALAPAYATLYNYWVGYSVPPSSARPRPLRSPRPGGAASPVVMPTTGPAWRSPMGAALLLGHAEYCKGSDQPWWSGGHWLLRRNRSVCRSR